MQEAGVACRQKTTTSMLIALAFFHGEGESDLDRLANPAVEPTRAPH
jgi:hypothetical protein